jgi:HTH-type transcriptional regulator/antitoxin HigA
MNVADELRGDKTVTPPGDFIRQELEARNWTQADLATILGRPASTVNELVQAKRAISPEIAVELGTVFKTGPEVWMDRETAYRLSLAVADSGEVERRARLYELAPVKEMQKRGWIRQADDVSELEAELRRFFSVDDLEADPVIVANFRKSTPHDELTPAQKAWCARALQMARVLTVAEFSEDKLPECEMKLRKLAAFPQEARKVPGLLSSYGIRFVIIEPLQGSKIDGAAMWLKPGSPVIALSMRYDRIDAFWFNLGHEFWHIKNRDGMSVDTDLSPWGEKTAESESPVERRADAEAAALLIPPEKLQSFILRVSPLFSKERINQFANRIKIHPGIIVGQLQHRREIGYSANREMLVKVRDIVSSTAVTDGWGQIIGPKVFQ